MTWCWLFPILVIQIFSFWAQYGQNALSTPITMYKTDLPTLPIFGQHLRVFPYQIHIRSSHSGWQVWYMSWPRYESESSQQNTMHCVTPTAGRCVTFMTVPFRGWLSKHWHDVALSSLLCLLFIIYLLHPDNIKIPHLRGIKITCGNHVLSKDRHHNPKMF